MDCISRTGSRAVLGCSVSTEFLLGLYRISRVSSGAVVDCRVSVGLVLGQYMTVGYQ